MTKVLTFNVEVEGLEDKIWRKIEITNRRTVAELAYTILATFSSLAYHLYIVKYKDIVYDGWGDIEEDYDSVPPINAIITKLGNLGLQENDTMKMEYDMGSTITFKITYLNSREFEKGNGNHYPYIMDGQGSGIIDDISNETLKDIIEDIDKTGEATYQALCMDGRRMKPYDYRIFDLKKNNLQVRRYFSKIKNGYEVYG